MPKKKKQRRSKSSTTSPSRDRQSSHGADDTCPDCGIQGCTCGCDRDLHPVVGLKRNVKDLPLSASQVTWDDPDAYSLPPVDRSEYDLREGYRTRTAPSVDSTASNLPTSSRSRKSRPDSKQKQTSRWTEEFLVRSPRRGCWCRDCPWLIIYGILLVVWVILVCLCFFQKNFNYNVSPRASDYAFGGRDRHAADCLSACSRLIPPVNLTAPERAVFHCTLNRRNSSRWEEGNETAYNNSNCGDDCKSFGNVGDFIRACTVGYVFSGGTNFYYAAVYDRNTRLFDESNLDWHWIAHIMLIANTVSLFLLLMPLFFCCMQVTIISLTSIGICIALSVLLWYYVYSIIKKHRDVNRFSLTNQFFIVQSVFAVLSTILTVYVIILAMIVMTKRLKVSCEVARFTSKFVNSVPTILLEALLTLILLLVWAVAVLLASIAIEGGEQFISLSGQRNRALPYWALWVMRAFTGVMAFWTAQFIINCQTIIIHGAMARFYFDKALGGRVTKSHKRLLKYHLCTACFAGLLFNWLYWVRWFYPKSIIRSRSLFGTATYGATFVRAGKEVNHLLQPPQGSRLRAISKVNPFYFLMHIEAFAIMAIVTHLVFYEWKYTLYIELILVFYAYFVILATVNIYRVTKDSIFLCYELDRSLTSLNPERIMKMPDEDPYQFARQDTRRVNPRLM